MDEKEKGREGEGGRERECAIILIINNVCYETEIMILDSLTLHDTPVIK